MMEKTFYAPFRASPIYQRMYRDVWAGTSADPRAADPSARSPAPATPRRPASALEVSTAPGVLAAAAPDDLSGSAAAPATPQPRKATAGTAETLASASARPPAMPPRAAATTASAAATPTPTPVPSVPSAVPTPALSVAPPASLHEVLKDPTGLFYFREFMERQRATTLINFWVTVEGYSTSSGVAKGPSDDDTTLRQDTAGLYALYFSHDAAQPIALSKPLLTGIRGYIDNQVRGVVGGWKGWRVGHRVGEWGTGCESETWHPLQLRLIGRLVCSFVHSR